MRMTYIRNIAHAFPFLLVVLCATPTSGSFDQRRTAATGTCCQSSATADAYIVGGDGELPLIDNMKIKKSDCTGGKKVPVPIKVVWQYCNNDSAVQTPVDNMIIAKYKSSTKFEDVMEEDLDPGACVTVTSYKNINFCKRGATMSLKYEATFENTPWRSDCYCYAYNFKRARREWLDEDERRCGTTADVSCEIGEGEANAGEKCAGNIRSDLGCRDVNVVFVYKYCNFNASPDDSLKFDRAETWHKLNGVKQTGLDRTVLTTTEKCREKRVESIINTCTSETLAELQVTGFLPQSTLQCQSSSEFRVLTAQRCNYEFIMTEIVQDRTGGTSFIEIYTPNCGGQIVTDDFQIVKYKGKGKPLQDVTNMKGIQIDKSGFIVFCLSEKGNTVYGKDACDHVTGDLSPADSVPGESIAIIEGRINHPEPFIVRDTFGSIKNGEDGPNYNLAKPRCVRKRNKTLQQAVWDSASWSCVEGTADNTNPGCWFDNCSPTSDRVDTKPPSVSPGDKGAPPPVSSPVSAPVSPPTPKNNSCDYDVMITEIVTYDDNVAYIELFSNDSCIYGKKIKEDLFIEVIQGTSSINLRGSRFDDNGFLVLCSTDKNVEVPDKSCNDSYDLGPIGSSSVRLYRSTDITVDIFGYPNGKCDQGNRFVICFSQSGGPGRVARKPGIVEPKVNFKNNEWLFYSDSSMTPGTRDDSAPGPKPSSCNYDVIITEIVVFNDKVIYIEVRATDRCAYGRKINYDLFLEIVGNDAPINLRDYTFDSSGFIVVCTTRPFLLNKMTPSDNSCGPSNDFGPVGSSSVRLYNNDRTLDIFGDSRGDCTRANICFSSPGRVARNPDIDQPNMKFDIGEWLFYDNDSMSPGAIDFDRIDSSPRAPTRSPASNGGGRGKGKGGKGGKIGNRGNRGSR